MLLPRKMKHAFPVHRSQVELRRNRLVQLHKQFINTTRTRSQSEVIKYRQIPMSKKINTAYNESLNVKFKNSAVKNIDQHKSDLPQFRNNQICNLIGNRETSTRDEEFDLPSKKINPEMLSSWQTPSSLQESQRRLISKSKPIEFSLLESTKSLAKAKSSKFLHKGASVNRSILLNVLRSKLNPNTCGPSHSYTDAIGNEQLINAIRNQIPTRIKDIVSAEQMVRMSHVFTGGRFRTVDTTQQINQALCLRRQQLEQRHHNYETNYRSIKRWGNIND